MLVLLLDRLYWYAEVRTPEGVHSRGAGVAHASGCLLLALLELKKDWRHPTIRVAVT